jgi:peroxiredoxin Q/BCP
VTYVIDKEGVVQYIFNSQFGVEEHIENALEKLKEI